MNLATAERFVPRGTSISMRQNMGSNLADRAVPRGTLNTSGWAVEFSQVQSAILHLNVFLFYSPQPA